MKSLEQHLNDINSMRKQLELLEAELNELRGQGKQQPKFEYPIYMQSVQSKSVVKFTDLTTGVVVAVSKFSLDHSIGNRSNAWIAHTNTATWQPITFDEERGIADKQLCECWGSKDTHIRAFRFYDAKNKCAFDSEGRRIGGICYHNYRQIPYADYPQWAIEAEKTLKD